MGNQLTGIAPSQIQPTDFYLTDVVDYEFDTSLGSTRFFKVARARYKEGLAVVKVFVIHDPSLPLKSHREKLEELRARLEKASNCLPFQRVTLSDKASLLFRQYVKDSLYDRISTRPFFNNGEKQWIAFQLLCALNQCHKLGVCHGDIKSENVMVTGWSWVLLTDFASFKPTYLPEDNPSDFSYFFDTSRRRTCYIAPERFIESSWRTDSGDQGGNIDLTTSVVKKGDLTPSMDIFSAGCAIIELFTDGTAPFDLAQLLSYRSGEYSPWKILEKIEDSNIRELARHMIQKDPNHRLSAEEYLIQQRGKAFPDTFYTFLKLYIQRFASTPIMSPDARIMRVKKDLDLIKKELKLVSSSGETENTSLVILVSLLTSNLRDLNYCSSKLDALDVLKQLSEYLPPVIIMDRLVPYMLHLIQDQYPRVRAAALRTITQCLANIKTLPVNDANIFPEYILPNLSNLVQDPVVMVRVAYAENIALLAETALRFLEIIQLEMPSKSTHESNGMLSQQQISYDIELQALHEQVQQKVVQLLSDPDNIVKETLLQNGITQLCVFFGRQKANDVLLSHMITFLNDKFDWHIRGVFFDSIVGVAAYVGWHSSGILKPLLQQGLSDTEEFVIQKALSAMTSLTELGLLQKPILHEFIVEVVPFLCHPDTWVRYAAVGFISATARSLNIADMHCNLLPLVKPFLKQQVLQVGKEVVLMNALKEPLSRTIYDYILRSPHIEKLFDILQERKVMRQISRQGHKPNYSDVDEAVGQLLRKLMSQGLTEQGEDKLLALKDFMVKLNRARAGSSEKSSFDEEVGEGRVNLASAMMKSVTRRHAELFRPKDYKGEGGPNAQVRKSGKKRGTVSEFQSTVMNEEWKHMFGSTSATTEKPTEKHPKLKDVASHKEPTSPTKKDSVTSGSPKEHVETTISMSNLESSLNGTPKKDTKATTQTHPEKSIQVQYSQCKMELHNVVYKKRDQYANGMSCRDILDVASWEKRPPPSNWKPKGLLVAHLHEHRLAVNRMEVSDDHNYFTTCSNDGTVKIWECSRMEGKSVTNRSRQTYSKQGGQIKCVLFCENSNSLASCSDNGSIHILNIESGSTKITAPHTRNVDISEVGQVVDMNYADTGSQSILVYATVHGHLIGWDLRSNEVAWNLCNDPKKGLITSFSVHRQQNWLAVGTSSGTFTCWDMRFQLPITSLNHPTGARVRKLLAHPSQPSWVVASVQGNNEVSMWDLETDARYKTLWASTAPALSRTQASSHSVNGMHLGKTDTHQFLLTAGSDMRIRYWDLDYPKNSHIVATAASDPVNNTVVSYRSGLIEGTDVIQEVYSKQKGIGNDEIPRREPDTPPQGHHDVITDIKLCQTMQCLILTSSRDGVVKVWK
ncbi:unnamed protein product [Owenia fusiformis]|uniref:non-specific serine/threonine protein kinase n=1 Tax=Owenia fusiformis TaxID=6347 RepID=A0A8J1Y0C9_OWEFU|nr:unnamed protein product [Owenia fusiformis]